MGWSSWNAFHRDVSEELYRECADAIVSNGMKEAGYDHINQDGGWWEGADTGKIVRNASGFIQVNLQKFPNGLEPVIDYVHSKGLKYGHYTDSGKAACNGDVGMSEGNELKDVTLFASWKIDMIKVDACHTNEQYVTLMERWQSLLNATGRPILFSNCRNACLTDDEAKDRQWFEWCPQKHNMWRTGRDIQAEWVNPQGKGSFLFSLDTLKGRGKVAGPGAWNDPDFLEVGVGEFEWNAKEETRSRNMNQAHFSMWCITSAPLIAGNDVRSMPPQILSILTNSEAIAVNQQYAGNAGDLITNFNSSAVTPGLAGSSDVETWLKPLPRGKIAVAVLNRNTKHSFGFQVAFADIPSELVGLPAGKDTSAITCHVRNIWSRRDEDIQGAIAMASLSPMAVDFMVLSGCKIEALTPIAV